MLKQSFLPLEKMTLMASQRNETCLVVFDQCKLDVALTNYF